MRFELVASAANLVPLQYILKSSKGVCANTITHGTNKEAHSKFSYRFVRPSARACVRVCALIYTLSLYLLGAISAREATNQHAYLTVRKARTNFNFRKELKM